MVDLLAFWSDPLILPICFGLWLKLREWTWSLPSLVPRAPWPSLSLSIRRVSCYIWLITSGVPWILHHLSSLSLHFAFVFFFPLFLSQWDSFLKEPIKGQIWPPGRLSARHPAPAPQLYVKPPPLYIKYIAPHTPQLGLCLAFWLRYYCLSF